MNDTPQDENTKLSNIATNKEDISFPVKVRNLECPLWLVLKGWFVMIVMRKMNNKKKEQKEGEETRGGGARQEGELATIQVLVQ